MDRFDIKDSLIKRAVENITDREDADIVDIQVNRASREGDGLVSTIVRVKVVYRWTSDGALFTKTFVVKLLPEAETIREMVKGHAIFEKEASYFSYILPLLSKLADGKATLPVPESYLSVCNQEETAIFLEDLRISGFKMAKRSYRVEGMDLPHCEVAMELLGKLHGLAAVCEKSTVEKDWENLKSFKELCYYVSDEGSRKSVLWDIYHNSMKTLVHLAKTMEGLPRRAAESGVLENLLERSWKKMCQLIDTKGRVVPKVACHGDFWMNNIMFRYDKESGRPLEAKVIDFQVIRHSHPLTDIFYLLYCCMNIGNRIKLLDHLLDIYHQTVVTTTNRLNGGSPFISLEQLKSDAYGEYRVYGVVVGALWHPLFMMDDYFCGDPKERFDISKIEEMLQNANSHNVKQKFAEDEIYRKEIEEIIKELVDVALPKGLDHVECSPFH